MARTYNNLFCQVVDFENLHRAYLRARAGKRHRGEVMRFEQDLEGNLIHLQNELIAGTYKTGEYRLFNVYEPKLRQVAALPFRDRVAQHALVAVVEPLWERRFIADSYACRPGRGTHRGADRAQAMARKVLRDHGLVYALKADVKSYFGSIDHAILKGLLRQRIACRRTLSLFDSIIDSSYAGVGVPVGLPIGNLTSQLAANIYLHELDLFAKHALREPFYLRYMDDIVILHHDKDHLHCAREQIAAMLWDRLRLRLNSRTQVFPVSASRGRPLDFLGYRIYVTHRRIRRSSVDRIKASLRRLGQAYAAGSINIDRVSRSVTSWIAHAGRAQSHGLRAAVLDQFRFMRGQSCQPT